MTFSYQYDKADWIAFYRHFAGHSSACRQKRLWSNLALVPFALLLVFWGLTRAEGGAIVVAVAGVVGGVAWILFFPRAYENCVVSRLERAIDHPDNIRMFGSETMTLTPEHLHVQMPRGETTVPWEKVVRAERTDDYIFIYLSAVEACVIPHASLAGASFDEVWTKVNEYLDRSRHVGRI